MISLPIRTLHLVWIARLKCGLAPAGASRTRRPRQILHPPPPPPSPPLSIPQRVSLFSKLECRFYLSGNSSPFSFSRARVSRLPRAASRSPPFYQPWSRGPATKYERVLAVSPGIRGWSDRLEEQEILLSAINRDGGHDVRKSSPFHLW